MITARGGDVKNEVLLLGLSRDNVDRLVKGQPIRLSRETHGDAIPEGWKILILFGETEQDIANLLRDAGVMDDHTKTTVDPRLNQKS